MAIDIRTGMSIDTDPGCEVSGNDDIEENEDTQRKPEEQTDDIKKESFCPGRIYISGTGGIVRIILVVCNGQDR